jgi:polysaccharide deacetylase family protein (PEP-CTERM system associated)
LSASKPLDGAFTVDVEDYFQVDALSAVVARDQWDRYSLRVSANTGRLLDLLDRHGVRGTFFVLGWVAQREPGVVRAIAARGHEVACHGMSHRLIYTQTPQEFRRETRDSKRLLEDLAQCEVMGYRAATYSITNASLWALDVIREEGFRYDSSIFPVRHDRYGIPGARMEPHRLATPSGHSLTEFPLSAARLLGANLPMAGGGYFRLYPYGLFRWGLRRVRSQGRPIVFYLHPWEVDPDQPRVTGLSWRSRFRHYLNLAHTLPRLERLLAEFRFGTVREVLEERGLIDARPGTLAPSPLAPA